ncbi:MAG: hypothetical protein AAGI53_14505 [Planctomycetota bacterium]
MPHRLFRLYQRKRVININANVIAAGLGSTAIVAGLLALLKYAFGTAWPTWGYTVFSLAADIVLDVAIFSGLHWLANHWRPFQGLDHKEKLELGAAAPPHLEDTAQVQLERAVLSPLYYVIAVIGTELLQRWGLRPYWAVSIAYPLGLLVTRTIHTWWGLKSGTFHDHHVREKKARIEAKRKARELKRSQGRGRLPDV